MSRAGPDKVISDVYKRQVLDGYLPVDMAG